MPGPLQNPLDSPRRRPGNVVVSPRVLSGLGDRRKDRKRVLLPEGSSRRRAEEAAQQGKLSYFSYVRALAVFALVLQTGLSSLALPMDSAGEELLPLVLFHGMSWAFPCFLMVCGAELLDPFQELGLKHLFGRHISRLVWSLLLCGLLYRGFDMVVAGENFSLYKLLYSFYEIFTGSGWPQLRFVYVLLSLYLLLPFWRMVARMCSGGEFRYFLLLQFFFLSLLPLLGFFSIDCGFYIQILSIYPFYFFLGHVIHRGFLQFRTPVAVLVFLLGSGLVYLFLWLRAHTGMEGFLLFCSESSFPTILQAMGVFAFFESLDRAASDPFSTLSSSSLGVGKSAGRGRKVSLWDRIWISLGDCAYGICLLHVLLARILLYVMAYFQGEGYFQGTAAAVGFSILLYALSWVILALVKVLFRW